MLDDLKSAARSVLRARALTAVLVISLGLGTGANAAVFGVAHSLLFRAPAGVAAPSTLANIYTSQYDGNPFGPSSFPDYRSIESAVTFESVAAADDRATANLRVGTHAQAVRIAAVSENFFATLGLSPWRGRVFQPGDASATLPPAVISHELWLSDGSPDAVGGKTILIGTTPHVIVGVAPPRFRGLRAGRPSDVWVPLNGEEAVGRGERRLSLVGRMRGPGQLEAADASLARLSGELASAFPATNRGAQAQPEEPRRILALGYSPLAPEARAQGTVIAGVVTGAVALLLAGACVNAGSLLLSRGFARRRELAVKMALGAARRRLVRQLVLESLLTSLAGMLTGLLFASWAMSVIPALFAPEQAAMLDAHLHPGILSVAVIVACVAAALFGIPPALQATSAPAALALRADTGGISAQHGGARLRAVLVGTQIALSTLLLLLAAVLLSTFKSTLDADATFSPERIAVAAMQKPGGFVHPFGGPALHKRLAGMLGPAGHVSAIGWSTVLPLGRAASRDFAVAAGAAGVTDTVAFDVETVSFSYFDTMGLPLLEGRLFNEGDRPRTEPVVIVNEVLARRHFGAVAAGQYLVDPVSQPLKIVGVVGSRKYRSLQEAARPIVYYPASQTSVRSAFLFVRVDGDTTAAIEAMAGHMAAIDPNVEVVRVSTLAARLSENLVLERLMLTLVSISGGLALVMSVIGVYGVMNDAVQRRTREIGLRVALGAARRQVAGLIFAEALSVSLTGLIAGAALAVAARSLLASFVSGVPRFDLFTLGVAPVALAAIVVGAAIVPLRRALRVSAAVALRAE